MFLILIFLRLIQGELLTLTKKNYTIAIQEYNPLVIFYNVGDRTSTRFIQQLNNIDNKFDIQLAYINSENIDCKLYYSQDIYYQYKGPYSIEPFVNWLKAKLRQSEYFPSVQINQFDQLQKRIDLGISYIAVFVTPSYRLTPLVNYVQTAKTIQEDPIFFTHTFKLYQYFQLRSDESRLMFYSPEEKKWNKYSGDIKDSKQMIQFMRAYQFKGYFDIKNETEFKELIERKDKMMLIITLREDDDIEQYRIQLYKLCILGKMKLNEHLTKQFNIESDNLPKYIAIKPLNQKKYQKYITYENDVTPLEFYNKIMYNEIEQYYYRDVNHKDYVDEYGIKHLSYKSYLQLNEQWIDDDSIEHVFYIYEKSQQLNYMIQVVKSVDTLILEYIKFYVLDYSKNEIYLHSYIPSIQMFGKFVPKHVHFQYVKNVHDINHYISLYSEHKKSFKRSSDL